MFEENTTSKKGAGYNDEFNITQWDRMITVCLSVQEFQHFPNIHLAKVEPIWKQYIILKEL